jgi:tetratricopeptide (TPR) repeat protein
MSGVWRLPAAALLILLAGGVGHPANLSAQPDEEADADWPRVISQLRQQMYERPGHAQTRHQLAIAYNNYGVDLGNERQWVQAEQQLEEAIRLDGANAQFRTNLSHIYLNQAQERFEQHDLKGAADLVEQALGLTPDVAAAHALLGEIEYNRQRLKEARAAWQRSLALDPAQQDVADRLDRLGQELPVESQFERVSQAYFDLRYEEELDSPVGFDIRDVLLAARREVGSDFAYWPKHKIIVLIYSAEKFRAIRRETPEWVAGQFDGKIRVPIPGAQMEPVVVRSILFHEYTHALIQDLANHHCPRWLNEGLAEYEGRTQHREPLARLSAAHDQQQWIPWADLSDYISSSASAETVGLAYEQSYSMAAYLVQRHGFWRIRRVLQALGEGQPWEAALTAEYRVKLPRLEAQWREWLPEFLRQGGAPGG